MDSHKLKDEEEQRNNGQLNSEMKDEFESNTDSPVVQSAPSGFINGKGLDESPSSAPQKPVPENKGKPLKKWRRIRRDFTKSVSPDFTKEGSPGSGRGLTDSTDLVQMHKRRIPLPDSSRNGPSGDEKERADDVEGESSVASVESRNTGLNEATNFVVPPVVSLQTEVQLMINTPIFSIGAVDSENSEDCSSKSSTAASVPRFRRENLGFGRERGWSKGPSGFNTNQRAPRGRGMGISKKNHLKIEAEYSNSNSNVVSNGKHSDKSVNYDGENSDQGLQGEEVRSAYFRENGDIENSNPVDLDSNFEEGKNSRFENPDLDPLVESIVLLETAQEALETELEKWMEIGKEEMEEESEEIESPDSKFEIQELNENINHLKFKLEVASTALEEKDSRLIELESHLNQTLIPSDLDQLIQAKLEYEIKFLVITKTILKWERTLQDSKLFVTEQKSIISENKKLNVNLREMEINQVVLKEHAEKLEDELKEKSEKLEILDAKNKTYDTSLVYIIELILVGLMLMMFLMFLLPTSSDVVPT